MVSFASGSIAAMAAALVTSPLEIAKTRLQTSRYKGSGQTGAPVRGIFHVLRNLIREGGGVGSAWRGIGIHLAGVMPARGIYFASYAGFGGGRAGNTAWENALAGGLASGIVVTLTNPIWVLKTRAQLVGNEGVGLPGALASPVSRPTSWRHVCAEVWRRHGWRGFTSGLCASYVGIAESAIQMALYESLRKGAGRRIDVDILPDWAHTLCVGYASKIVASTLTYPHEVIRTRLRDDMLTYRNCWQAARHIWRVDGVRRGLYGGMLAHLTRVGPNMAITFMVYEMVRDALGLWQSR